MIYSGDEFYDDDVTSGPEIAQTPLGTVDILRAALLRIFDLAENRPDIRAEARAALLSDHSMDAPE